MKYHNPEYIKSIARSINEQPKDTIKKIIKDLQYHKEVALEEYNSISEYTSPEEVETRKQTLYYYEDLLNILKNGE